MPEYDALLDGHRTGRLPHALPGDAAGLLRDLSDLMFTHDLEAYDAIEWDGGHPRIRVSSHHFEAWRIALDAGVPTRIATPMHHTYKARADWGGLAVQLFAIHFGRWPA